MVSFMETGATNRPQELDEAARRRLTKRLYVPLPSSGASKSLSFFKKKKSGVDCCDQFISWNTEARAWIVKSLLEKDGLFKLSDDDIVSICKFTEGIHNSCC